MLPRGHTRGRSRLRHVYESVSSVRLVHLYGGKTAESRLLKAAFYDS